MNQDLRQRAGSVLVKFPPPGSDNDSNVKYEGKSLSWSRLSLGTADRAASQGWSRGRDICEVNVTFWHPDVDTEAANWQWSYWAEVINLLSRQQLHASRALPVIMIDSYLTLIPLFLRLYNSWAVFVRHLHGIYDLGPSLQCDNKGSKIRIHPHLDCHREPG